MRIPVPTDRLVAFTFAGALLTMIVAAGLAFPGPAGLGEEPGDGVAADTDVERQVAGDAPEPNRNFTPVIRTQSGYGDDYDEHEDDEDDDEEHEDHEDEYDDEYDED